MRKSSSTTRSRWLRAGVIASTTAAVVLAMAPPPAAFAASTMTVSPSSGVTGQVGTITATGAGGTSSTTTPASLFPIGTGVPGALFTTSSSGTATGTCPAYTTTTTATVVVASAVKATIDSATITLPEKLVPAVYTVCVYATAVAGSTATVANTSFPTYTVSAAAPVLGASTGVLGGGNTITATATGTTYLSTVTTPTVTFLSTGSCPTTYSTTNALPATAVKTSSSVATITVPSGVAVLTAYKVCIFDGATSASLLLGASAGTYTPTPPAAVLNPTSGLTGGGNNITATVTGFLTGISNPGVTFSATTCPTTYTTTTANLVGTGVTRPSDSQLSVTVPAGVVAPNTYNVCVYADTIAGASALVGTSSAVYTAMLPVVALSATTGKIGGGNTITGLAPNNFLNGIPAPGVTFATAAVSACPATYTASTLVAAATRIGLNRLAITVPVIALAGSPSPSPYKVCIYDGTVDGQSTLIALAGTYSAAAETVLLSVSPSAGPAIGKSPITVTGTGLPIAPGSILAASLGGVPLENVKPVGTTSFTANTPAHLAASNLTLSITTAAGTFTLKNAFTYTNGIVGTPNTAPKTTPNVDVYVVGVGFTSVNFSTTLTDAHIYLVNGVYNAAPDTVVPTNKTNGPVAECKNVLVIGDTELICSMQLSQRLGANGTFTTGATRTVTDGVGDGSTTFTSATAKFTSADVGLAVAQTGGGNYSGATPPTPLDVLAGTTIVSVTNATTVVLSQAAANIGSIEVAIGGPRTTASTVVATPGSATVTAASGTFKTADVGRPISGTGITPGTTILSISGSGGTLGNGATLSRVANGSATSAVAVMTISAAAPVPDGAYTLTFVTDGSLSTAIADPANYSQSIITSGSTFTVADY